MCVCVRVGVFVCVCVRMFVRVCVFIFKESNKASLSASVRFDQSLRDLSQVFQRCLLTLAMLSSATVRSLIKTYLIFHHKMLE